MKLVETWSKVLTLIIRYDNRERSVKKEDDKREEIGVQKSKRLSEY